MVLHADWALVMPGVQAQSSFSKGTFVQLVWPSEECSHDLLQGVLEDTWQWLLLLSFAGLDLS